MRHGAAFTAFFDSSAFYPTYLRDLLLRLAWTDLFRARWSKSVLDETVEAYLLQHPGTDRSQLERACSLINEGARDSLVEGHEILLPAFVALEPASQHVVAAACHGRSDVIVTKDGRRYPDDILKANGLHKQHPDEFIAHLIDLDNQMAVAAIRAARLAQKPSIAPDQFLALLARAGLATTGTTLRRRFRDFI